MNIIIEGPDGSGKSTLAHYLYRNFGRPIITSPGPSKDDQAFADRVSGCLKATGIIFDRHPVVSEDIYGTLRGHSRVTEGLRLGFYDQRNLFIYSTMTLAHEEKAYDTLDHLRLISQKRESIRVMYERWALTHAHLIYRGDKQQVFRFLQGAMS